MKNFKDNKKKKKLAKYRRQLSLMYYYAPIYHAALSDLNQHCTDFK